MAIELDLTHMDNVYNMRPSAQGLLLETSADCLEVIEKAVDWEAEQLYGVEGQGPFDEF